MFVAIMAIAVILDSPASPDPSTLVKQLGSSRYALRITAEGELIRIGRPALSALRAARDSKDAEIRTRSMALVSRIENSLLLEATPIDLNFNDVPIPEAIETLERQVGHGFFLAPEDRSNLQGRRISLKLDRPLPYWEAIDAFCSAGRLHCIAEDQTGGGSLEHRHIFVDGPMASSELFSDAGAFRVHLTSVHYQSEIQLDQRRATQEFFLQFVVSAEPRLSITRNGAVRVISALDDRGQSLLNPSRFQHEAGYFGMSPSSLLRFRVELDRPDSPGRIIKSLRGTIPIIATTRKPNPLVMTLTESKGKQIRSDEIALIVLDYRPPATNQPATIQLVVRPLVVTAEPINPGNGEPLAYRPESFQQQIEVLDAQGHTLNWFPSCTFYDGEETRLTLTVGDRAESRVPTTLRYHGITRVNFDIPFQFHDIPIP